MLPIEARHCLVCLLLSLRSVGFVGRERECVWGVSLGGGVGGDESWVNYYMFCSALLLHWDTCMIHFLSCDISKFCIKKDICPPRCIRVPTR